MPSPAQPAIQAGQRGPTETSSLLHAPVAFSERLPRPELPAGEHPFTRCVRPLAASARWYLSMAVLFLLLGALAVCGRTTTPRAAVFAPLWVGNAAALALQAVTATRAARLHRATAALALMRRVFELQLTLLPVQGFVLWAQIELYRGRSVAACLTPLAALLFAVLLRFLFVKSQSLVAAAVTLLLFVFVCLLADQDRLQLEYAQLMAPLWAAYGVGVLSLAYVLVGAARGTYALSPAQRVAAALYGVGAATASMAQMDLARRPPRSGAEALPNLLLLVFAAASVSAGICAVAAQAAAELADSGGALTPTPLARTPQGWVASASQKSTWLMLGRVRVLRLAVPFARDDRAASVSSTVSAAASASAASVASVASDDVETRLSSGSLQREDSGEYADLL